MEAWLDSKEESMFAQARPWVKVKRGTGVGVLRVGGPRAKITLPEVFGY